MPSALEDTSQAVGKYLTFGIADEQYAIEILRVREIVGLLPVTRVPRLPDFVAGVVNLRGRIVPVVDLRLALGLQSVEAGELTCIVVVKVERTDGVSTVMGAIVDEVTDVASFSADEIEATPEFGAGIDTSFIKGVGRAGDRVVLLLDVDRVLNGSELDAVERAASVAPSDTASPEGDA